MKYIRQFSVKLLKLGYFCQNRFTGEVECRCNIHASNLTICVADGVQDGQVTFGEFVAIKYTTPSNYYYMF
jgi:hypothetical protein